MTSAKPKPDQDQDQDQAAEPKAPAVRGPVLLVLETGAVIDAPNKVATHCLDPDLGIDVPVRSYIDVPQEVA